MPFAFAVSAVCIGVGIGLVAHEASAQWVTTNGPAGATTKAFNVTASKLFAATGGGGVFTTTNYTSWTSSNGGLTNLNLSSVVRSADMANALLVGTLGGGVFKSVNNGASWLAGNAGLTNTTVRAMSAIPDGYFGTVYFAGTDSGVFRGNTFGTTWMLVNTGLTHTAIRAFTYYFEGSDENDGIGANDLLAGTNGGGVFLSNDGVTWWAKNNGLTNLVVNALSASTSYAVTFAGTAGGGVFRSTSIWGAWSAINVGLGNLNVTALTNVGTKVFAGTSGGGVFVANNDGASGWTAANTGLTNLTVTALAANTTHLFAATNAGVFRRPLAQL